MKLKKSECRKVLSSAAVGALALLWWGVLYPELCFPEDTYEIICEHNGETNQDISIDAKKWQITDESCYGMLDADEERIIVSSRFLEWLKRYQKE